MAERTRAINGHLAPNSCGLSNARANRRPSSRPGRRATLQVRVENERSNKSIVRPELQRPTCSSRHVGGKYGVRCARHCFKVILSAVAIILLDLRVLITLYVKHLSRTSSLSSPLCRLLLPPLLPACERRGDVLGCFSHRQPLKTA